MFKMIKWTVISVVTFTVAGFCLFGTDAVSYLSAAVHSARKSVKDQIPVEFEIRRAEHLIEQIAPEIRTCKRELAQAQVELEDLVESVERLAEVVENEEMAIKARKDFVALGNGSGEVRTTSWSANRRTAELERLFDSYRSNCSILETKSKLITRQTQGVEAARQRLAMVSAEKDRLEDQVQSLKTQKKWLDSMVVETKRFDLDDSHLAQAREALMAVQKRLDVTQKMLENEAFFDAGGFEVAVSDRDIVKEIDEHFAKKDQSIAVNPR